MKRPVIERHYILFTLLAVAASLGLAAGWLLKGDPSGPARSWEVQPGWPSSVQAAGVPANESSLSAGVSLAVRQTLPAVVNISSTKVVRRQAGSSPSFPPLFEEFFGRQFPAPRERRAQSLGSGVTVSEDGHILTNDHVISGADEIEVTLADKREFDAEIIGRDPKTDLALIKIKTDNRLPVLRLSADSADVEVGDFVLAVGNPFGLRQTVTFGIVSATGRGGLGIEELEDFIQTDASINPGNSGGALVNLSGELVGINTAIVSRGGGNQGIGFAVPSNMARDVMKQLSEHGRVVRGWLGVVIQPVTPALAESLGLDDARGAIVASVAPGSPAAEAGIERGDVVVKVDDQDIEDARTLQLQVARSSPGDEVALEVIRNGERRNFSVELGESKSDERMATGEVPANGELGITVQPLTGQIARQLGLQDASGVLISGVEPGSPAAEAGLRRGDVIEQVGQEAVPTVERFHSEVRNAGDVVLLLVNRGGQSLFVPVERN